MQKDCRAVETKKCLWSGWKQGRGFADGKLSVISECWKVTQDWQMAEGILQNTLLSYSLSLQSIGLQSETSLGN